MPSSGAQAERVTRWVEQDSRPLRSELLRTIAGTQPKSLLHGGFEAVHPEVEVDLLWNLNTGPGRAAVVVYPNRPDDQRAGLHGTEVRRFHHQLASEQARPERCQCTGVVTVQIDRCYLY